MNRGDIARVPASALMACALSLSACVFDAHELRTWTLPAKQQSIDSNPDHWVPFAFSEGSSTVTIKIPPDFRSFHVETLPQAAFDKYSHRRLLDVGQRRRLESSATHGRTAATAQ